MMNPIEDQKETKLNFIRSLINQAGCKVGGYLNVRFFVILIFYVGMSFTHHGVQIYQAQDQNPIAILYVGDQQNVGYTFCVDGSDSHSASTDHFTNKDDIENFIWDFGDGTQIERGEYLNTHTHKYHQPGTYTITLTVVDKNGLTDSTTSEVMVKDLPRVTVSGNLTSAINAGISQLNGQPGIVDVPAGEYRYDQTINIPNGVFLEGAGMESTRLFIDTNSDKTLINIAGNNIRITGLKLEGYTTQTGPTSNNLTRALSASGNKKNLYIDHCEVMAFRRGLIISTHSTATVEYSYIHHNTNSDGYGFLISREAYVMIRFNEASNNRHTVAAGGCGSTACPTRYDVIGNYIHGKEDVELKACEIDMHTPGHGRIRVIGNTFENVSSAVGLRDGLNVEVKDNTFRNVNLQGSSWTEGLGVIYTYEPYMTNGSEHDSPGADGLFVENNTFDGNCGAHLYLPFGKNLYANCRKMDDQVPFRGNIDWNDCQNPSKTCSELNGNICISQQICSGDWLSVSDSERCCSLACISSLSEDINEDGVVNAVDLQIVVNASLGLAPDAKADVNKDGRVNGDDILRVINAVLNGD
jgi:PKD repeat protein